METMHIMNVLGRKAMQNGGETEYFYFSDLVTDAKYIQNTLDATGKTHFYWLLTNCGTHIYTNQKEAKAAVPMLELTAAFVIDVNGYRSNGITCEILGLSFLKLDLDDFKR